MEQGAAELGFFLLFPRESLCGAPGGHARRVRVCECACGYVTLCARVRAGGARVRRSQAAEIRWETRKNGEIGRAHV